MDWLMGMLLCLTGQFFEVPAAQPRIEIGTPYHESVVDDLQVQTPEGGKWLPWMGLVGMATAGVSAGKVKSWLFKLLTTPIMTVIYWVVIADGLRLLLPALGIPLYKLPIPGISYLRLYQGFNKFDLANCLLIFLCLAVFFLWLNILRMWLYEEGCFLSRQLDAGKYATVLVLLGLVILGSDIALFYWSMCNQSWLGGGFSFSAALITLAYTGVVVFVSFMCVSLEAEEQRDA
ncbi:MAG: hypothetical protein ACK4RK_19070 [Gemmataceae bacterium]